MNDEIKRINEQNREFDERVSPGDQSQARDSSVTSPDEDNRKKKVAEGIIAELANNRQEIDLLKQTIEKILDHLNQEVTPQTETDPNAKGLNIEALGQLGDLLEKGISAYKSLKGTPPGPPALIDQEFINKRMVESFLDDLETGKSITHFIKDSLKKNVTKKVINTSLADMGKDTHDPQ